MWHFYADVLIVVKNKILGAPAPTFSERGADALWSWADPSSPRVVEFRDHYFVTVSVEFREVPPV